MLRELSFVCNFMDIHLPGDLIFGLPMAGAVRPPPYMMQRVAVDKFPVSRLLVDVDAHNQDILHSVKPAVKIEVDRAACTKAAV